MELDQIVKAFAKAISVVDSRCPGYVSRSNRQYQPGIGPYAANKAMELVTQQLCDVGIACGQFIAYPAAAAKKCDIWLGEPLEWVIEVKMGRFRGDNGKPDDTGIKDLISPFSADRSALTDGVKLAESEFAAKKAVLVYGFDDSDRPLGDAIDTLDALLRRRVVIRDKKEAEFAELRHPVFQSGRVVGWEIGGVAEA